MEFNGWGLGVIALYVVCKHGFKFFLVAKIGSVVKKAKGMLKNDDSSENSQV